jgi:hypothetical protein
VGFVAQICALHLFSLLAGLVFELEEIMPKLNDAQICRLSKFIGRDVAHEVSSCQGYCDITDLQLKDIKKLTHGGATLDAILYVLLLLGDHGDLRNASSFVDNMTNKNMSVSDWMQSYYHAA